MQNAHFEAFSDILGINACVKFVFVDSKTPGWQALGALPALALARPPSSPLRPSVLMNGFLNVISISSGFVCESIDLILSNRIPESVPVRVKPLLSACSPTF
jgi:hypothetical protein